MTRFHKVTVSRAPMGRQYSIRRGSKREYLGTLLERSPHTRTSDGRRVGYDVTFGEGGEIEYSGFAGAATVVLLHLNDGEQS